MSYPENIENDTLIISVNGDVDLENSDNLREQVSKALGANTAVSLNRTLQTRVRILQSY